MSTRYFAARHIQVEDIDISGDLGEKVALLGIGFKIIKERRTWPAFCALAPPGTEIPLELSSVEQQLVELKGLGLARRANQRQRLDYMREALRKRAVGIVGVIGDHELEGRRHITTVLCSPVRTFLATRR